MKMHVERRSFLRKTRFKKRTTGIRMQRFYRRNRITSFEIKRRQSKEAESKVITNEPVLQIDLLTGAVIDPSTLKIRRRFVGKKARPKREKKMVQYKIPFWKGVKGTRKRALKARCHETEGNDTRVFEPTTDGYRQFLATLLEYIPKEIAGFGARDSGRIAEIVAWISRRDYDEPFSFQECCAAVGVHPDNSEEAILATIRELYGQDFNHFRILRNNVIDAEAGDQRAVDWVLSTSDVGKSFNDCCRALGFNPKKARSQILIPPHMIPEPIDERDDAISIEAFPTDPEVDENQASLNFG